MLRAATGALCPNAVPELSCPSLNKIPLSSGADWGGTKRSPFITASRSHLASARGECRHRHPAPPRRREPGRAGESRGEQLLGASIHGSLCSREPELNVEQRGQVSDHSKVPLCFAFRRTVCSAEPMLGKAPSVIRINLTQLSGELSDS